MVKKFDSNNFEAEVLNNKGIVLVDFYAEWCGPCKMLAPILEEVAEEREDIVVGKIDIDESFNIAAKYGVMSIPTLIIFKNGDSVATSVGFMSKSDVLELIDEAG